MEGAATEEERKSLEEFKLIKVEREIAELKLKLAKINTDIKKNNLDLNLTLLPYAEKLELNQLTEEDYQVIKEKKEAEKRMRERELTKKKEELTVQMTEKQTEKESLGAAKSSDGDMPVKSSPDSRGGGSKRRRIKKKKSKKRRSKKRKTKKRKLRGGSSDIPQSHIVVPLPPYNPHRLRPPPSAPDLNLNDDENAALDKIESIGNRYCRKNRFGLQRSRDKCVDPRGRKHKYVCKWGRYENEPNESCTIDNDKVDDLRRRRRTFQPDTNRGSEPGVIHAQPVAPATSRVIHAEPVVPATPVSMAVPIPQPVAPEMPLRPPRRERDPFLNHREFADIIETLPHNNYSSICYKVRSQSKPGNEGWVMEANLYNADDYNDDTGLYRAAGRFRKVGDRVLTEAHPGTPMRKSPRDAGCDEITTPKAYNMNDHPLLKMTHEKQKAETEKFRQELKRMEELRRAREREGEGRLNSRDN